MLSNTNLRATVRRVLNASAEEVFEYWTQAKKIKNWLGLADAQVDARVGGSFRFHYRDVDCDPGLHTMSGEYRVLEPTRIVSSWIYQSPRGEVIASEFTVEIEDAGPGLVRLTVSDENPNYSNRHERAMTRLQWSMAMGSLESVMDLDRALGEGQWYRNLPQWRFPFRRTAFHEQIWFDPFELN